MYLAFICNIKSLPHLALCIFYLIKIEAENSHVYHCSYSREGGRQKIERPPTTTDYSRLTCSAESWGI